MQRTKLKPLKKNNMVKMIIPIDEYLKISDLPFKVSRKMMIEVAFWAQNQSSFKQTSSIVEKVFGIEINSETIRLITDYVGNVVFNADTQLANTTYNKFLTSNDFYKNDLEGTLYIETDGAALNTRIEDVNGSTWRENKLGLVFSSDNILVRKNEKGEEVHQITKKEYTSYLGGVEEFKKYLLHTAIKNGYGRYKKTIILSDGATWIRNMANDLFPDSIQILDFYHLSENVYSYAKVIFNNDEKKYVPWAEETLTLLRNSECNLVLDNLKKYKNIALPTGVVNLTTYLTNNINKINYKKYKDLGYYIGSGAIESGNKSVLQKRCKQAGMRWSEDSAQPILTLRAKQTSDLWFDEVALKIINYNFRTKKVA